jgi:hypothetical protein
MQFKKVSISLPEPVLKATVYAVKVRKKRNGNDRYGLSTFITEMLAKKLRIKI